VEGWPTRQSAAVRMRNVAVSGAACGATRRSTAGAARRSIGDDHDEQHNTNTRRGGQYGFENGEGGDERQAQGEALGKEHRNLQARGVGSWVCLPPPSCFFPFGTIGYRVALQLLMAEACDDEFALTVTISFQCTANRSGSDISFVLPVGYDFFSCCT
jgi:hypothetical protein